ncbi:MAG: hypothetical protein K0S46_2213 [Moraxellaceae bacterium]|jgi:hypothetical protein|nr:hypothetical protein [Moraxellaceae bacterium]
MDKPQDVTREIQQAVKAKYHGRYSALARRLGDGWDKMKLSRLLNSKDPAMAQLLTVCATAGVAVTPYLQRLHL